MAKHIPGNLANITDVGVFSTQVKKDGYYITAHPLPFKHRTPPKKPDKEMCLALARGKISVMVSGTQYNLSTSDRLYLNPGETFEVTVHSQEGAYYFLGTKAEEKV